MGIVGQTVVSDASPLRMMKCDILYVETVRQELHMKLI